MTTNFNIHLQLFCNFYTDFSFIYSALLVPYFFFSYVFIHLIAYLCIFYVMLMSERQPVQRSSFVLWRHKMLLITLDAVFFFLGEARRLPVRDMLVNISRYYLHLLLFLPRAGRPRPGNILSVLNVVPACCSDLKIFHNNNLLFFPNVQNPVLLFCEYFSFRVLRVSDNIRIYFFF